MRLYYSPTSPFVRYVRAVLEETALAGHVELVPASGTAIEPGSLPVGYNPLGKIPTLEREDGPALHDSRVIVRYLDDMAGGSLCPAKPRYWETLTLESMALGMSEAAVLMAYEVRLRPEDLRSEAWLEGQWLKVTRSLDALEDRWLPHLLGPLDAGQIALATALGYLDFRHGERGWRDGRPGLSAWETRFAARPSMIATAPPPA